MAVDQPETLRGYAWRWVFSAPATRADRRQGYAWRMSMLSRWGQTSGRRGRALGLRWHERWRRLVWQAQPHARPEGPDRWP